MSENGTRYYKPFDSSIPTEELEITRLIFARLKKDLCMDEDERETVAYRIAEIMVAAKHMYTKSLARLINAGGESNSPMEDDLTGLQMTFTHLCDLMHDFDSVFLRGLMLPPAADPERMAGLDGEETDGHDDY